MVQRKTPIKTTKFIALKDCKTNRIEKVYPRVATSQCYQICTGIFSGGMAANTSDGHYNSYFRLARKPIENFHNCVGGMFSILAPIFMGL